MSIRQQLETSIEKTEEQFPWDLVCYTLSLLPVVFREHPSKREYAEFQKQSFSLMATCGVLWLERQVLEAIPPDPPKPEPTFLPIGRLILPTALTLLPLPVDFPVMQDLVFDAEGQAKKTSWGKVKRLPAARNFATIRKAGSAIRKPRPAYRRVNSSS